MAGDEDTTLERVTSTIMAVVVEPRTLVCRGLVAGLRSRGIEATGVAALSDVTRDASDRLAVIVDRTRMGIALDVLLLRIRVVAPAARIVVLDDRDTETPSIYERVTIVERSSGVEALARTLTDAVPSRGPDEVMTNPSSPMLSDIERSIMRLIAVGATAKEAAAELRISPRTVENHKRRIFARLGAVTQAQAVALAIRAGELNTLDRAS